MKALLIQLYKYVTILKPQLTAAGGGGDLYIVKKETL